MRLLLIALFVLLAASSCHAAYIYGDIYKANFEKHNKTVVSVQGRFSYQLVTENSNYSLFLPEGDYNVSGSYYDEQGALLLYASEQVKVGSDDQRVDLVLKPVSDNLLLYIAVFIILMIAVMHVGFRRPKEKLPETPKRQQTELDAEGKKVLKAIEGFGGRVTQKELRLALKYPDAKLSLILAELEELGHIRKFRRGRGNIIRIVSSR